MRFPGKATVVTGMRRAGKTTFLHQLRGERPAEGTYVRTPEGYEVDFLARDAAGGMELMQVCGDLSDPATAAREGRTLSAAGELFPPASDC